MRPPTQPSKDRPQRGSATHTILIIDDDPDVARSLTPRLEGSGFAVLSSTSGNDGYWLAQEKTPDLILLDYKMPDGAGNRVLGKLKTHPQTRHIPVIILSGMTNIGVQRDVLRLGAEEWINKPYDGLELLKAIRRYL